MVVFHNSTVEKKMHSRWYHCCLACAHICMGVSILRTVSKLLIYNNMYWAAFIFYLLYIWVRETTMKSWILNLTVNSRRGRRQGGQWPITELLRVIAKTVLLSVALRGADCFHKHGGPLQYCHFSICLLNMSLFSFVRLLSIILHCTYSL